MKGTKFVLLMVLFVVAVLSSSIVRAEEITLDTTDINDEGFKEKILVGEIKANYLAELDVKNTHDVCNVTASLINSFNEDITFGYPVSESHLNPGENATLSYVNKDFVEIPYLAIMFEAHFNDSAYVDQQTEVIVEYEYRIYDDRGNLVLNSSEENKDDDKDDESNGFTPAPQDPSDDDNLCCSSTLTLAGILTIPVVIIMNYLKTRRKNNKKII